MRKGTMCKQDMNRIFRHTETLYICMHNIYPLGQCHKENPSQKGSRCCHVSSKGFLSINHEITPHPPPTLTPTSDDFILVLDKNTFLTFLWRYTHYFPFDILSRWVKKSYKILVPLLIYAASANTCIMSKETYPCPSLEQFATKQWSNLFSAHQLQCRCGCFLGKKMFACSKNVCACSNLSTFWYPVLFWCWFLMIFDINCEVCWKDEFFQKTVLNIVDSSAHEAELRHSLFGSWDSVNCLLPDLCLLARLWILQLFLHLTFCMKHSSLK